MGRRRGESATHLAFDVLMLTHFGCLFLHVFVPLFPGINPLRDPKAVLCFPTDLAVCVVIFSIGRMPRTVL